MNKSKKVQIFSFTLREFKQESGVQHLLHAALFNLGPELIAQPDNHKLLIICHFKYLIALDSLANICLFIYLLTYLSIYYLFICTSV